MTRLADYRARLKCWINRARRESLFEILLGNRFKTLSNLGSRRRYLIDKKLRQNVYELTDGVIIKDRGLNLNDTVVLSNIRSWRVEYEMIFDIVHIHHVEGVTITWLDYHNDLLAILRQNIPEKEVEDTRNALKTMPSAK